MNISNKRKRIYKLKQSLEAFNYHYMSEVGIQIKPMFRIITKR